MMFLKTINPCVMNGVTHLIDKGFYLPRLSVQFLEEREKGVRGRMTKCLELHLQGNRGVLCRENSTEMLISNSLRVRKWPTVQAVKYLNTMEERDCEALSEELTNLKIEKNYNEIVERSLGGLYGSLTKNPDRLIDFAFAHLHSGYAKPQLVEALVEGVKEDPLAEYVLGLSHYLRATVAKAVHQFPDKKNMDGHLFLRYLDYFPTLKNKGSEQLAQESYQEAIKKLTKAFVSSNRSEVGVALLLALLDSGDHEAAQLWSKNVLKSFPHDLECVWLQEPSFHWLKPLLKGDI